MKLVHTTIETVDGWTRMVYHKTCVAQFKSFGHVPLDGKLNIPSVKYDVRLNTGGFFTKTTKKRMNEFAEMFGLPFRVVQDKGEWFVFNTNDRRHPSLPFNGNTCEFTVTKQIAIQVSVARAYKLAGTANEKSSSLCTPEAE